MRPRPERGKPNMKKQRMLACLCAVVLLIAFFSCPARAEDGAITASFAAAQNGRTFEFSFDAPDYEFLRVRYSGGDESGVMTIEGEDGHFSGAAPLYYTQSSKTVTLTVETAGQKKLFSKKYAFEPAAVEAAADDKGASKKITDLTLTPGEKTMGYRFTAPGHHAVRLKVSSVAQKAEFTVLGDENGLFEGELSLPFAYARDLVTVTVLSLKGAQMAKDAQRTLFTPLDAGETAPDGPLSGVIVCLDPGHQAVPVSVAQVYQMPDSKIKVKGGSTGMAQGKVTLRKESIVVLELAYQTCAALRAQGATVYMTRWDEETAVTNMERAEYANGVDADFFIRIHLNMAEKQTANAIYVYSPNKSPYAAEAADKTAYHAMAQALLDALKESTGVKGGTTRFTDQFVANNWAKMPAFLIEAGFMSTPANDVLCSTPGYQKKIVDGIVNGVLDMWKIKTGAEV